MEGAAEEEDVEEVTVDQSDSRGATLTFSYRSPGWHESNLFEIYMYWGLCSLKFSFTQSNATAEKSDLVKPC